MRSGSGQRPPRGHYSGNKPQQQRTPQRNHTFDSNGLNVRIRGSAHQIFERYIVLAREAAIGGDHIAAENFHQHAEHYFRLTGANDESAGLQLARRQTPQTIDRANAPEPERSETNDDRSQPEGNLERLRFT